VAAPGAVAGLDVLLEAYDAASSSIFRAETRQTYHSSDEDEAIKAYLAGVPLPADDLSKQAYTARVRAARGRGCSVERVHVATEPFSDYLRYELDREYPLNIAAGELILIWPTPVGLWPAEAPVSDFWLFDEERLFVNVYDHEDRWLYVTEVTDEAELATAQRAREAALRTGGEADRYIRTDQAALANIPAMRGGA
jgi:hypothetical protein